MRMINNLWAHRELIRQLIVREITQRYKGTVLGIIWSFITPLILLTVYTFVFSVVFQAQWGTGEGVPQPGEFALILFAGLIPFNLFAETVNRAPTLILNVPNYAKKVVFPLEILPLVSLGSSLVHSFFGVLILLAAHGLLMGKLYLTSLLLPLAYLPLLLLCLGLGWLLASLGVFLRDIGQAAGVVVQLLFFLTPVFYPITAVPESLRWVLYINPLTTVLSSFRRTLLWGTPIRWDAWGGWLVLTALLAYLGYAWFMRTKKGFADVM